MHLFLNSGCKHGLGSRFFFARMENYQCINECKIWVSSSQKHKASEDTQVKDSLWVSLCYFVFLTAFVIEKDASLLLFNMGLGTSWGCINNDTFSLWGELFLIALDRKQIVNCNSHAEHVVWYYNASFFLWLFLHATCFILSNPQSLLQTANTIAGSILNNNALQILIYNHSPSLSLSLSLSLSAARMHSKFHLRN